MIEKNKIYNSLFPDEKEEKEETKEEIEQDEHMSIAEEIIQHNIHSDTDVSIHSVPSHSFKHKAVHHTGSSGPNYNSNNISNLPDDDPNRYKNGIHSIASKELSNHETVSIESADERK
jgi:hypothetical protein